MSPLKTLGNVGRVDVRNALDLRLRGSYVVGKENGYATKGAATEAAKRFSRGEGPAMATFQDAQTKCWYVSPLRVEESRPGPFKGPYRWYHINNPGKTDISGERSVVVTNPAVGTIVDDRSLPLRRER